MQRRARSIEDKEERRSALLKAALDIFYEKGLARARMDDIAERAGVSKGTIYLYFSSKDELFQSLIDSIALPRLEQVEKIAKNAPTAADAINGFTQMVPAAVRQSDLPRLMKVIIGESQLFAHIIQNYRENVIERVLGIFSNFLAAADARGEIAIEDPDLTAKLLLSPVLMSGLWVAVFEPGDSKKLDIERLMQIHARNILKAITP